MREGSAAGRFIDEGEAPFSAEELFAFVFFPFVFGLKDPHTAHFLSPSLLINVHFWHSQSEGEAPLSAEELFAFNLISLVFGFEAPHTPHFFSPVLLINVHFLHSHHAGADVLVD